jgi:acetoin utilization deacetylase AcuC-like enzyme
MAKMIKVIYGEKLVADSGSEKSPSASKPKWLAQMLAGTVEFIEPIPVSLDDIKLCHYPKYVDDVMSLKSPNGFGTISQSVVDSLPYTNGAMYQGAKLAIADKRPVAALVSGFHHAGYQGYDFLGYFCTFNGLMIAAMKLEKEGLKTAIIDCDMHYGNGTDDIIGTLGVLSCLHITFGKYFVRPSHAKMYLNYFDIVREELIKFKPNVILYQAGVDVHIDDPYGGVLTEEQMYYRDFNMFTIAKQLDIPIVWNLAGGYQVDKGGGHNYVLHLHMNTFSACREAHRDSKEVYGL